MHYKFIFLPVLLATLYCVPALADDDANVAVQTTSETDEEPGVEIIDQDDEIETIKTTIDSMGWCPDENSTADETDIDIDQENEQITSNSNRGVNDERRIDICKKLQELQSLEAELAPTSKQAAVNEAEQKYADAKENENSLANRTLGSVTMAATGIGGMELARGLAEQKADAEADAEMNMYISTFQCKVGENGKYYQGGTKSIETPGANQLIKLYQEYVDLAADLKARKEALGQKPGIESEVILDKAATGMYDEVGHGIENGTFASIYRASKGNATDAQKLDDAKSASKKRVIGGAVAAGAGAVGGMVGNMIINGKKNSEDSGDDDSSGGTGDVIKSIASGGVEKAKEMIASGQAQQVVANVMGGNQGGDETQNTNVLQAAQNIIDGSGSQ